MAQTVCVTAKLRFMSIVPKNKKIAVEKPISWIKFCLRRRHKLLNPIRQIPPNNDPNNRFKYL